MLRFIVADTFRSVSAQIICFIALSLCLTGCDSSSVLAENTANQPSSIIDIATYNIQSLGQPEDSRFNGTQQQQIQLASKDIIQGGAEIYALQEVADKPTLALLLKSLNQSDQINSWGGAISLNHIGHNRNQHNLAFIYQQNIIKNASFQTLLSHQDSWPFVNRYPFMMTAKIHSEDSTHTLKLVNFHLKCCRGKRNNKRRAKAMALVIPYLNRHHNKDNMILLGDLNVAGKGGAYGEIRDWGIYNDRDNNNIPDYFHAAGSVQDTIYNPSNTDSDIDHILISDELKPAWDAVSNSQRNRYLNTRVSDHSPVVTRLDLSKL